MNLTKQICHKAAHFDAVAFDVFDTLIKRDVAVPIGLFRLMGDDFYAARIRAEERLQHKQSMHEYYQSKIALDRAMQRLQTAAKYKR